MRNENERFKHQPENNQFRIVEANGGKFAVVAFTDLDGTVNDETKPERERLATIAPAKSAIAILESKNIPVGIITGRSFGEAVLYQRQLSSHGPIICEDGAVVVLPKGHYSREILSRDIPEAHQVVSHENRTALILSKITKDKINEFLQFAPSKNQLISTTSSAPEEIQGIVSHPSTETAKLSMDRLASAYIAQASQDQINFIQSNADSWGVRTFGTPLHLIGKDADKGHALHLINKYAYIFFTSQRVKATGIIPVTFGNNTNDIRLSEETHKMGGVSVIVGKPGGGYSVHESDIPEFAIKTKNPFGKGMLESLPEVFTRLSKSYNINI